MACSSFQRFSHGNRNMRSFGSPAIIIPAYSSLCRPDLSAQLCISGAETEDGTYMLSRIPPSPFRGFAWITRTRWRPVANSVSRTVFFRAESSWRGQWALNAWPNFAITPLLLGVTLYLAGTRVFSFLA